MNVVKILLVLGLGYVALTQKVVKTRNMLLVVTGLLAFCMFSMEGFTIDFNTLTSFSGSGQTVSERTITVGSGNDQIVYTLPTESYNSDTTPVPGTGYSCTIGNPGAPGVIGKYSGTDAYNDSGNTVPGSGVDITKIFTCTASNGNNSQSCADGKTALKKTCPDFYSDTAGANCAADPCVDNDFKDNGPCCEKSCDDSKCTNWTILGFGAPKDGKMCKKDIFGLLQYYCEN